MWNSVFYQMQINTGFAKLESKFNPEGITITTNNNISDMIFFVVDCRIGPI